MTVVKKSVSVIKENVKELKNKKMKKNNSIKSLVLGVVVAMSAVGAVEATERMEAAKKMAAGDVYVNTTMAGGYSLLTGSYNDDKCQKSSIYICSYERTELDEGVVELPATFDHAQAQVYLNNGWLVEKSTEKGIYLP